MAKTTQENTRRERIKFKGRNQVRKRQQLIPKIKNKQKNLKEFQKF